MRFRYALAGLALAVSGCATLPAEPPPSLQAAPAPETTAPRPTEEELLAAFHAERERRNRYIPIENRFARRRLDFTSLFTIDDEPTPAEIERYNRRSAEFWDAVRASMDE